MSAVYIFGSNTEVNEGPLNLSKEFVPLLLACNYLHGKKRYSIQIHVETIRVNSRGNNDSAEAVEKSWPRQKDG